MTKTFHNKWQAHWFLSIPSQKAALYRISFFLFLYIYYSFCSTSNMWQWALLPDELWVPPAPMRFLDTPLFDINQLYLIEKIFPAILIFCTLGLFTKLSITLAFIAQYIFVSSSLSYGAISHTHFATTIFLFLFIFINCSQELSLDSLLFNNTKENFVSFWPIQLQRWVFGAVFFAAAYSKLSSGGHGWFTTDTLKNYLLYSYYRYSLSPLGKELALGPWLAKYPLMCKILAFFTIILELLSPALVFANKNSRYAFLLPHFIMIISFYFLATTGFVNMFSIYLCWLFNPTSLVASKAKHEAYL